jgi:hypothetical protein
MNISRYANIDKFVNIWYIFFTSPSGIQLIISASPNVEITSPGRRASGFFNPCILIAFKRSLMGFFNFRWFYFKKGNRVCLKENAVSICPDIELSWCRTVFFNGCRNVLVSNCLVSVLDYIKIIWQKQEKNGDNWSSTSTDRKFLRNPNLNEISTLAKLSYMHFCVLFVFINFTAEYTLHGQELHSQILMVIDTDCIVKIQSCPRWPLMDYLDVFHGDKR